MGSDLEQRGFGTDEAPILNSTSHPSTPKPPYAPTLQTVLTGAILGVLIWQAGVVAGIQAFPLLRGPHGLPLGAALGAALALTRARWALWWAGGMIAGLLLLIGYTPLMSGALRPLIREDPLQPSEAVVVLSSDLFRDGSLTAAAQTRLLRGFEVVRQGYAKRLVLTRLFAPKPSALPAVTAQMRRLDLRFPVEETTDTVHDTHDEALAISKLARERGWDHVILVSDPTHMRRAGAVFEKAGVRVLCTPGPARDYSPNALDSPRARIDAFRDWVYEVVGYQVYRWRGWI